MTTQLDALPPDEKELVDQFWKELDEALEEASFFALPWPVTFADLFEHILGRYDRERAVINERILEELSKDVGRTRAKINAAGHRFHRLLTSLARPDCDTLQDEAINVLADVLAHDWRDQGRTQVTPEDITHVLGGVGEVRRRRMAGEFLHVLKQAEEARFVELGELVGRLKGTPKTHRFLVRVSRCYLYGFDVECLVMCRGAVEAGLEAEVSVEVCNQYPPPNERVQLRTIAHRIYVAKRLGKLTHEQCQNADQIRRLGNSAVHELEQPPRGRVLDAIEMTIAILQSLTND